MALASKPFCEEVFTREEDKNLATFVSCGVFKNEVRRTRLDVGSYLK